MHCEFRNLRDKTARCFCISRALNNVCIWIYGCNCCWCACSATTWYCSCRVCLFYLAHFRRASVALRIAQHQTPKYMDVSWGCGMAAKCFPAGSCFMFFVFRVFRLTQRLVADIALNICSVCYIGVEIYGIVCIFDYVMVLCWVGCGCSALLNAPSASSCKPYRASSWFRLFCHQILGGFEIALSVPL